MVLHYIILYDTILYYIILYYICHYIILVLCEACEPRGRGVAGKAGRPRHEEVVLL